METKPMVAPLTRMADHARDRSDIEGADFGQWFAMGLVGIGALRPPQRKVFEARWPEKREGANLK